MKLLIISSPDPFHSGKPALDFHEGLKLNGHNSILITRYHENKEKSIYAITSSRKKFFSKAFYLVTNKLSNSFQTSSEYYYDKRAEKERIKLSHLYRKIPFTPDAIIIFFSQGLVTSKIISELFKRYKAPIYFYLMDMSPLTGGCHYAWDCSGYKHDCQKCPAIVNRNHQQIAQNILKLKKKYLNGITFSGIAATTWSFEQLKKSSIFKNQENLLIPLSVNSLEFKPIPQNEARNFFHIPLDSLVLFFGAQKLDEKRKGILELVESLNRLHDSAKDLSDRILLLIAGNCSSNLLNLLPFPYLSCGMLDPSNELALAYNSSDVFLCPSIQDAGPLMINQSLMCGTPVVAFRMGIAPDVVLEDRTGYLATLGNIEDFSKGILKVISKSNTEKIRMSNTCIEIANSRFDRKTQAMAFLSALS